MSEVSWFDSLLPVLTDAAIKSAVLLAGAGLLTALMHHASAAKRHLVWVLAVVAVLGLPMMGWWLPAWRVLPAWAEAGHLLATAAPDQVPSDMHADAEVAWIDAGELIPMDAEAWAAQVEAEQPHHPEGAGALGGRHGMYMDEPGWDDQAQAGAVGRLLGDGARPWRWQDMAVLAWLFGALVVMAPMVLGWWRLARLRCNAEALEVTTWQRLLDDARRQLDVRCPVRLRRSAEQVMPMTWRLSGFWVNQ